MIEDFRFFEVADPFGRTWQVKFLWQQNAISIRHADGVDVKFLLVSGETAQEKVVALAHSDLLRASRKSERPLTDAWICRLAALHVRHMIQSWEDMEKNIAATTPEHLERYDAVMRPAVVSGAPAAY